MSNFYLAFAHDLAIIPVINKIDLPNADVDGVRWVKDFLEEFTVYGTYRSNTVTLLTLQSTHILGRLQFAPETKGNIDYFK